MTTGREAHTNPEDDLALARYEIASCRAEIERLRRQVDDRQHEVERLRLALSHEAAERQKLAARLASAEGPPPPTLLGVAHREAG